jgi:hypothetical protein
LIVVAVAAGMVLKLMLAVAAMVPATVEILPPLGYGHFPLFFFLFTHDLSRIGGIHFHILASLPTRVDAKVNFSILQNTKFYAKLIFISRNFVQIISQNFAEFCGKISRHFVK